MKVNEKQYLKAHTVLSMRNTLAIGCTRVILFAACLLVFGAGLFPFNCRSAAAQQEPETDMTPEEIQTILDELFQSEGSDFTYTSEGRSDPFVPFVTDSSQSSSAKSDDVVLIGLRKYEPGQLQLVAIVFAENDPIAMVQDSLGKGYILHRGTKIGRTGEVEDISPNVITIKQMVSTPTRKQRYKTIEMILRKEGDKRQ